MAISRNGGTTSWPNRFTWKITATAVYKPAPNALLLEFTPSVITLSGPVGVDLQAVSTLKVVTDSTTRIRITWPKIAGIKYLENTHWVDESKDVISDSSTYNIHKTIKISGDRVGQKSIAIPVTGETV